MDLSADSGRLPTHTTVGGAALEQELSLSSTRCQTESGGTILLQLLEFKTHLLEVVEELHIHRDAETRFEDQISKLVLEKQELEWEKESLQHQTETVANQHTESLISVKKQFQAKIRNIEEEKGKYQVNVELKDKEINNLKEELKSLQLLKYNLEKKSSELEQKLALQSRSKDSHLNQLGEVEKRFSALARQCAMVKQAHEKLEQNVYEAMKINTKLTTANGKQDATIVSLKKELEEVSNKLIKAKMSSVRHDKTQSPTGREWCVQQLHRKLNMESEINKKLGEENVAVRAEKQEVMRSLQQTQQLLLSQTQIVSRVEMELQTQRDQYQALKQEHEVMREKSKAMEDKVAQLMESYAASRTSWDKEKAVFMDRIKSEQQDLQAVKEAYDELHQKHTELSSQAKVQARHIYELEMRGSSLSDSPQLFPSLAEEIRGVETPNEPISSSELHSFGSLQHLASTQTKNPDGLEDTGTVTKLAATGATGGQDFPNQHEQFKEPLNPSNPSICPLTYNNLLSLCSLSGTTGSTLNKSNTSNPEVVSDVIYTSSFVPDDDQLINKAVYSCVSDTSTVSSPSHRPSISGSIDLLSKERCDEQTRRTSDQEQGWKDDVKQGKNIREEEERNEEQQWNREDVKGGESVGKTRRTLMAQTTDRAEGNQLSTKDARDTKQPETETEDRAEGTDGVEQRVKTGLHTPETQILAQTTTDTTTKKSDTQQVIDFVDTEPPLAACEPPECSQSVSQIVSEKDADSSLVNRGHEISRQQHTFCSDDHQNVSQEVQHFCHGELQAFAQDAESSAQHPSTIRPVFETTPEEMPSAKLSATISTEVSEPLNEPSICSSQTNTAPVTARSNDSVSIKESGTTTTQTQPNNPSENASDTKQTDEMCDTHVSEERVVVRTVIEPQVSPQSQETSEQESEQVKSLVTDDDSSAHKKRDGQSDVDTCENNACETAQEPVEQSDLKDACVEITMDTVESESEVETGSCQEKNVKVEDTGDANTTKCETESQLSVYMSHENQASPETGRTKCYKQSPAKEMLPDDTNESSLPSDKAYRSSFDWSSAQRTVTSRTHQFVQAFAVSEQSTPALGGLFELPPNTAPMFLKNKHSKVPLVITRASDLLNASSVSGTAASYRRPEQGERRTMGEICRETATTNVEGTTSLSISSFPLSSSSIAASRLSWQTTPGRATSAVGQSSESDLVPSCSQEREDQQSSFRAQISKIEQFLNTERLRLPKRRRTEN